MIHADTVIDLISLLVTDTYISHFCDTFIVVSLALFSVGLERFWILGDGGKVQNIGGPGGGANFLLVVNWSEPPPPISAK